MSTPHSSSFGSHAASSAKPAGGAIRRFFREVWQSYMKHSEIRVMLSTGQWTSETEHQLRSKMPG